MDTSNKASRHLEIAYWNASTLTNKRPAVRAFLEASRLDVLMVGETRFSPGGEFSVPNYHTYSTSRTNGPGGGTAIFIKKTIPHSLLPPKTPDGSTLENTGVLVTVHGLGKVELHAAYYPPHKTGPYFHPEEFAALLSNDTPKLVLGDFNAKHPSWNSSEINPRGKRLAAFQEQTDIMILGPDAPTHYDHRRPDVLDIAVVQNISQPVHLVTRDEPLLESDHLPIFVELGCGAPRIWF